MASCFNVFSMFVFCLKVLIELLYSSLNPLFLHELCRGTKVTVAVTVTAAQCRCLHEGRDGTVRLWSPCDRWDRFMQISEEDGGFYYRRRWSQRAVGGRQSREQAPSVRYRSGFSRSDVQYDFRGNQRRKLIRKVCCCHLFFVFVF